MNRIGIFFLMLCGVSVVLGASESQEQASTAMYENLQVWRLNRATVDAQKKAIQNYINRNAKARIAIRVALVAAATGALTYYLLKDTNPAKMAVSVPLKPEESVVLTQEAVKGMSTDVRAMALTQTVMADSQAAMAQEMKQLHLKVGALGGTPLPEKIVLPVGYGGALVQKGKDVAYGSYGLVKDIGIYFIQNLPATIAACFVNVLILKDVPTLLETLNHVVVKPIKRVNHALNIEWFLVTQLKVKKIYLSADRTEYRLGYEKFLDTSLARTVSMLPLASDDFERGHYVSSIVTDLNLFSRQLARVIAFCELRAVHIFKNNKVCAKHLNEITTYIFRLTQKFGQDMERLLASREAHAKVPAALQEFQLKLIEQLEAFRMYERAAYYDIIPSA